MDFRQVGDLLGAERRAKDPRFADLAVRSAFGRYYYAAFHLVRSTLRTMDPALDQPKHDQIPGHLRRMVLRKIYRQIDRQRMQDVLTSQVAKALRVEAKISVNKLADFFEFARPIRTAADYDLHISVESVRTDPTLIGVSLAEAKGWPTHVEEKLNSVRRLCQKIRLVR